MKQEKFLIKIRDFKKGLKQIEVEGWTHKGLGYFNNDGMYNVTHLTTGLCLYCAESDIEAEKFIEALTNDINCNCSGDEFISVIIKNEHIYKNARELATAVYGE